jgi:hypothetical protein
MSKLQITNVKLREIKFPKKLKINDIEVDLSNVEPIGDLHDTAIKSLYKQILTFTIVGISQKHKFNPVILSPLYIIAVRTYMLQYFPTYKLILSSLSTDVKTLHDEYIGILAKHIPLAQNIGEGEYTLDITNDSPSTTMLVWTTDIINDKTKKPLKCNKNIFIDLPRATKIKAKFTTEQIPNCIVTGFGYDPTIHEDKVDVIISNNGEINLIESWNIAISAILENIGLIRDVIRNNTQASKHSMNRISYMITIPDIMNVIAQLIVDIMHFMPSTLISHASVNPTVNKDIHMQIHITVDNDVYADESKYNKFHLRIISDAIDIIEKNFAKMKMQ